jgi:hypothetical protein
MAATYAATSGAAGRAGVWRAIVTLGGVDVSDRVEGEITVEADEGGARIADVTLRSAASSAFAVAGWVGKPVTIDIADYASGTAADVRRLFTGRVDTPALDLVARTIKLTCSDDLQGVVDAMSYAAIDAAIPTGTLSAAIFDPATTGWSRAQDRLSTVAAALDLTPAGALRLTAWAANTTPDITFTDDHLDDEAVTIALASRSQLINRVDIDFGYRFPRVKAEGHSIAFSYVDETSMATYVDGENWFLQRASVEQAIKSTGATIESISYTALPNAAIGQWVPGPYDSELCMGFSALVGVAYTQTIDERYVLTVSNAASIAAVGTLRETLSGALEGRYTSLVAAETSATLYANGVTGIPPQDAATVTAGHTTSADVTLTSDTDRAAAEAAMCCLINVAKVKIAASHRLNSVGASVPLNPDIDLDKTLAITTATLSARGKCRAVKHIMRPDTGEATTQFLIAISAIAGVGTTHPETATAAPAGSTAGSTALTTSPTVVFNGGASQDHTISVTLPAVATAERDAATYDVSATYAAPFVEDVFEVVL